MGKRNLTWPAQSVPAREYVCGFCGASVAPATGWRTQRGGSWAAATVMICHLCDLPTFLDEDGRQYPGVPFGDDVADIKDAGVSALYEEARRATAASCFTAAVLCCRKILMHVAVAKGASAGDKFIAYVEYLAKSGYIPPDAAAWVDHIRTKSNEANHEIALMSKADAEELMSFTGMLLKLVFEYPEAMKKKIAAAATKPKP
jgi:hypothetical protein